MKFHKRSSQILNVREIKPMFETKQNVIQKDFLCNFEFTIAMQRSVQKLTMDNMDNISINTPKNTEYDCSLFSQSYSVLFLFGLTHPKKKHIKNFNSTIKTYFKYVVFIFLNPNRNHTVHIPYIPQRLCFIRLHHLIKFKIF